MEEIIKKYLAQRCLTDDSLARNMKKDGKTIKGCCDYIIGQARKAAKKNVAMIEDDVVYGWAVHYFDEDNLKEDTKPDTEPKKQGKTKELKRIDLQA